MRKYLIALFTTLALAGSGCVTVTDTTTPPAGSSSAKLGEPVTFTHVTETITFEDGLSLTLKETRDSRCQEGVQCIWAGELSYDFVLSGGFLSASETPITLGSVTNTFANVPAYFITLVQDGEVQTSTMPTVKVTQPKPALEEGNNGGSDGGEAVFCTMDAKQCPDGSYVGRTPPSCEFAACP